MKKLTQINQNISIIVSFIVTIWAVWIMSLLVNLNQFGLTPREFWPGALGIITMPFLHAGLGHIISNTIPLFILLVLLCSSKEKSWEVVGSIIFLSGCLLWIFGQTATHVGASALIFGIITFLIFTGWFEKRLISAVVAVIAGFFYGTTLVFGVLPTTGRVSWDGHLCGAIAGIIIALALKGSNHEGSNHEGSNHEESDEE